MLKTKKLSGRRCRTRTCDPLPKKYLDKDKYPFRQPGEVRVLYKIEPQHFTSMS